MGRATELREFPLERPTRSHLRKAAWRRPHRVSRVVTTLPESKSTARSHMSSAREPGDLDGARRVMVTPEQPREGIRRKPGRRASEESDALVVPKKSAKTRVTPVESMEGRGAAKESSRAETHTECKVGKVRPPKLAEPEAETSQKRKEESTPTSSAI